MAEPVKNIRYAVLSAIEDLKFDGLSPEEHYEWLKQIAIRAFQHTFKGANMPSLKTVKVPINGSSRVWAWPPDYIRYTKIGYITGNRFYTMSVDPTIVIVDDGADCNESIDSIGDSSVSGGYWFWGWDSGYTPMYASGGGFNFNYYREDTEHGWIRFVESLEAGSVVIEYLSTGANVNELTLVPLAYMETLVLYLQWQACLKTKNLKQLAATYQEQYQRAMWDSNILAKSPTPEEIRDMVNMGSGLTIGR
jgi:hypothetical protein